MQSGNNVPLQESSSEFTRIYNLLFVFGISMFSIALLTVAVLSLSWEVHWDAMWMHRIAYLIFKRSYVPYRDVFDANMYGIFWIHGLVGAIGGYNNLALRIFDLLWLAAQCGCIWAIAHRLDWRAGWLAAVTYGWLYLNQYTMQMLQREHLMMLPVGIAVLAASSAHGFSKRAWLRPVVVGFLFGLGVSIKPHCIMSLPAVALYDAQAAAEHGFSLRTFRLNKPRQAIWMLSLAALGFLLPLLAGILWLFLAGGLPAFLEMVFGYWPLHKNLKIANGAFQPFPSCNSIGESLGFLVTCRQFQFREILIPGAFISFLFVVGNPRLSKESKGLFALVAAALMLHLAGMVIIGAYHPYSWMPVLFFLVPLHAFGFSIPALCGRTWLRIAVPVAGVVALAWCCKYLSPEFSQQLQGQPPVTPWTAQADGIMDYLKSRLQEGDKVQAIDILGGTDRALTLLGADNGTFLTNDEYMNIYVKNPFVQKLRERFLEEMWINKPRFVVIVIGNRLKCYDPDDDGSFMQRFSSWLNANYKVCSQTKAYIILERN